MRGPLSKVWSPCGLTFQLHGSPRQAVQGMKAASARVRVLFAYTFVGRQALSMSGVYGH